MSDNWYGNESWYAPLQGAPASDETKSEPISRNGKTKKKKSRLWLWGSLLLSLLAIVALSLIFREAPAAKTPELPKPKFELPAPKDEPDTQPGDEPKSEPKDDSDSILDQLPDSFREFFDALYPVDNSTSTSVRIPRGEAPAGANLQIEQESGETLDLKTLYERCAPSVVGISGYVNGKTSYSWGSGVILSEDGLIITNTHVIDGCDRATVTLYDDRTFEATLLGADGISDIALLKIEATGLPAARFGDSGKLVVGESVAAIGNPLGEEFRMTLTDGIISAISRDVNYKSRTMTLLQTNVAINEGNSGGPLFNMSGQVIGITNMKMISSGVSIEGIGFAIPSSTVETVVNAILKDGKVVGRTSIGITVGPIPESAAEEYDLPEGLYIAAVSAGSDAEAKGLKTGDILMKVNGQVVTETKQVADIKDQFHVGDELLFTIWRDGEIFEVSVALVDTNDVYG